MMISCASSSDEFVTYLVELLAVIATSNEACGHVIRCRITKQGAKSVGRCELSGIRFILVMDSCMLDQIVVKVLALA